MANLSSLDKLKLEKYLDMSSGYVCDFNNFSFKNFVLENTNIDIYLDKYNLNSGSKANRLRSFWSEESNYTVAKLLKEIIEYWRIQKLTPISDYSAFNSSLYEECLRIIDKLESANTMEDIDAINPNSPDESFAILASSIKDSINKGEPYQSLDRLHTFVIKYIRELCKKHSIVFEKETSLPTLFSMYRKFLENHGVIKSEMTSRILKSSVSLLESFNTVRNEESLAHDNIILSQKESSLIVSNIASILKFIGFIEKQILELEKTKAIQVENLDIPSEDEMEAAADAWIQMEIDRRLGK